MSVAVAITPVQSEVVHIASCPIHGLHGERTSCFECGGPVQQVPMVPVTVTTGEPCACGCKLPKRGDSDYHADACRTRHWKERTGYVDPRSTNGTNGARIRLLRLPRPGGRQLSYRRAVRVLAGYLADQGIATEAQAERVAERVLARALPARQRNPRTRMGERAA